MLWILYEKKRTRVFKFLLFSKSQKNTLVFENHDFEKDYFFFFQNHKYLANINKTFMKMVPLLMKIIREIMKISSLKNKYPSRKNRTLLTQCLLFGLRRTTKGLNLLHAVIVQSLYINSYTNQNV